MDEGIREADRAGAGDRGESVMAAQRSTEERMRIARECLKIERKGGDVLAYLLTENYYTPRATWINLQREFLRRKPHECKDGKPRKEEKRGMTSMALTNEQRLKAAQIAIDGGDPRPYLEECGLIAPEKTWWTVKEWLKKNHPEMADKLPGKLMPADEYRKVKPDKGMPKETPEKIMGKDKAEFEKMPTVKVDGGLKIETPEANKVTVVEVPEKQPKITKPLMHYGKKVIGLQGDFGTYFFKEKFGIIDFDGNDSEEISYTIDEWRSWMNEVRDVFQLLGVEL